MSEKTATAAVRMSGIVKFWSAKGFGFVVADDGREFFAHVSALRAQPGIQSPVLIPGQRVNFATAEGPRGLVAVDTYATGARFKVNGQPPAFAQRATPPGLPLDEEGEPNGNR